MKEHEREERKAQETRVDRVKVGLKQQPHVVAKEGVESCGIQH
jgi:hypothetical protein